MCMGDDGISPQFNAEVLEEIGFSYSLSTYDVRFVNKFLKGAECQSNSERQSIHLLTVAQRFVYLKEVKHYDNCVGFY